MVRIMKMKQLAGQQLTWFKAFDAAGCRGWEGGRIGRRGREEREWEEREGGKRGREGERSVYCKMQCPSAHMVNANKG